MLQNVTVVDANEISKNSSSTHATVGGFPPWDGHHRPRDALANSITEDIWELNDDRKFTSGPRLCPMNLDELLPDYAQFQAHKYEMHGI